MRLFRQNQNGVWDDVIIKMENELINLVKNVYEVRKNSELIF